MAEPLESGGVSGEVRRSKKRQAEDTPDVQTPSPKKTIHSFLTKLFSPSSSSKEDAKGGALEQETKGTKAILQNTTDHNVQADLEAIRKQQAARIDEMFAKAAEEEAEKELKDPQRKLKWNLTVRPIDEEWRSAYDFFFGLLQNKNLTIQKILEDEFEEAQRILIVPSSFSTIIMRIHKENSEKYEEALKPTGDFAGEKNNLATKMAMLHFGLPIEPMTLSDIANCHRNIDMDEFSHVGLYDEQDELPEEVERVISGEKPLGFLEFYRDRSYGNPMIRSQFAMNVNEAARKATPNPSRTKEKPKTIQGPEENKTGRRNQNFFPNLAQPPTLINPESSQLSMRGEAGNPEMLNQQALDQSDQLPGNQFYMYAYSGKLIAEKTQSSFREAALQLLRLDDDQEKDWSFNVDFPPMSLGVSTGCLVTKRNYEIMFSGHISPHLAAGGQVFVRTWGGPANKLEPADDMYDIIRIRRANSDTAYWKIPRDMGQDYGINQCQRHFIGAMQVLFNTQNPRPKGLIELRMGGVRYDIGFCGFEVVPALWKAVKEKSKRGRQVVELTVTEVGMDELKHPPTDIGIHLTGSRHHGSCSPTDWKQMYQQIHDMSTNYVTDQSLPKSFRIWSDAENRRLGQFFKVIDYNPRDQAEVALRDFFAAFGLRINCLWFRPEYMELRVYNTDSVSSSVKWKAGSLDSFREAVKSLCSDSYDAEADSSFCLSDEMNTRTFAVTKGMTENEWRISILDWFRSEKIYVKRRTAVDYVLHSSDWGAFPTGSFKAPMVPLGNVAANKPLEGSVNSKPENPEKSQPPLPKDNSLTAPEKPQPPLPKETANTAPWEKPQPPLPKETANTAPWEKPQPPMPKDTALTALSGGGGRASKKNIISTALLDAPKFHLPVARQAKTQKWVTWMTEQSRQDDLQRKAWLQDQSVIEPGKLPAPPMYGPSRERALFVGTSFPTVYAQRLTPTDIRELYEENQSLRNSVLDRTTICPICDVVIDASRKDQARAHFKSHQEELQSVGKCPLCESNRWEFMTMQQRKDHIEEHQAHTDSEMMTNFWKEHECPVCDADISGMQAIDILSHVASHSQVELRFCDRCGLNMGDCTRQEIRHHRKVCIDAPPRETTDAVPAFCGNCGTGTTNSERCPHCANRAKADNRSFCTTCGLNTTSLAKAGLDQHKAHCRAPRGTKKQFCRRCSRNLLVLDDIGLAYHRQSCPSKELSKSARGLTESESGTANTQPHMELANREAAVAQREAELGREDKKIERYNIDRPPPENVTQRSGQYLDDLNDLILTSAQQILDDTTFLSGPRPDAMTGTPGTEGQFAKLPEIVRFLGESTAKMTQGNTGDSNMNTPSNEGNELSKDPKTPLAENNQRGKAAVNAKKAKDKGDRGLGDKAAASLPTPLTPQTNIKKTATKPTTTPTATAKKKKKELSVSFSEKECDKSETPAAKPKTPAPKKGKNRDPSYVPKTEPDDDDEDDDNMQFGATKQGGNVKGKTVAKKRTAAGAAGDDETAAQAPQPKKRKRVAPASVSDKKETAEIDEGR